MNFELTDEQEMLRAAVRDFLQTQAPITTVRALEDVPAGYDERWWKRAVELGWTSMLVSDADGGGNLSGRPVADAVILAEEAGRLLAPGPFGPANIVASALGAAGSDTQRTEFLPAIVAGELVAAWAVSEDAHDPLTMATTAELSPDGASVIVNGRKAYVEAGAEAGLLLVVARTDDELTEVLVPAATPGVSVRPGRSLDLVRRYAEIHFDQVTVPVSSVLGSLGEARPRVERQLSLAIALQTAETVGVMDRAYDLAVDYAQERFSFGRPVAAYQAIKHRIADMKLVLESAKGTSDALARALDDGDPQADLLASVAKSYVGDQASRLVSECLQLFGGIGMTWEHDIHLYLRRAAVNRTVYGGPEFHRERICTLLEVSK